MSFEKFSTQILEAYENLEGKFYMELRRVCHRSVDLLSIAYGCVCDLLSKLWSAQPKLRVLAYHQICPARDRYPPGIGQQCISTEEFSKQMNLLSTGGYNVLTVREAIEHLNSGTPFPEKAVCITFDDGYNNHHRYALPIMAQCGIRATFYLVTDFIDRKFSWIDSVDNDEDDKLFRQALCWREIIEMRDHAMEFGSHSHTHPDFSACDAHQTRSELIESRDVLREHLNSIDNGFVVPFGIWGKPSQVLKQELISNGFAAAFMGKYGVVSMKADPFDLPRIIIYAEDSINVFKRKIDGAWDWFGHAHAFYHYLMRIC